MKLDKIKTINNKEMLLPAGVLLLVSGGSILLDQTLQTGWLSYMVIITAGLLILAGALVVRSSFWALAGGLFSSLGAGSYFLLQAAEQLWNIRLGGFLLVFGLGWLLVLLFSLLVLARQPWWMLLPGGAIGMLGVCFLFSPLRLADFILYVGMGVAIPLVVWGVFKKWIGLIIPGCVLVGVSSGIYLAWGSMSASTSLAQTGIMLVLFGLGCFLITLFSRLVTESVVWWPLIPGGILAVVGWGLYIGGDPGNALSFIGNTGSIALILFGIYLILLRRGIR